jgi:branched-chain amino acid transport system substrate-binding protein
VIVRPTRNRALGIASVCALGISAVWCTGADPAGNEPITIGAVLPLSGEAAHWGIPPWHAAELAIDEINAAGGIGGRIFKLAVEDDRCRPAEGVAAFNRIMAAAAPPVVLGAVCSGVTLAMAPLAVQSKTVLISPASTSPKITNAGDFTFRVIPSAGLRGKLFAEYLYNERGLRNVAALYINNEGGLGGRDAFKARFTQLGGAVVADEAYAQGATDIRAQLLRIKGSNADGVMVGSYPPDTVLVLQQARELRLHQPLFFQTEAVESPDVLREAGEAANGAVYILAAPATGDARKKFAAAYVAKFGHEPELFAAEAYDIVQLVAGAIAAGKDGPVSGVSIRDALRRTRGYAGTSGMITFDEHGDVIKPFAIRTIELGSPRTILVK